MTDVQSQTLADGKYALLGAVGAGAMGTVYRARHVALDRLVAIKVLADDLRADPVAGERLRREAQAASLIQHPNVVQVLDFGEDQGRFYIAMEFLEGRTLDAAIRAEGLLDPARAVRLMTQVLSALQEAHDHGVVHRDMKPENVMLVAGKDDDGAHTEHVKVCDFGIAKRRSADAPNMGPTLTAVGTVIGTPAYMSPEQARNKPLDGRTDLYSCGVILYRMVTGVLPFSGGDDIATLMMHVLDAPAPSIEHCPTLPPALDDAIMKALSKDPANRFATAREMRRALADAVPVSGVRSTHGELPTPSRVMAAGLGTDRGLPASAGRGRWWMAALAAVGVVAAVAIALAFQSGDSGSAAVPATPQAAAPPPAAAPPAAAPPAATTTEASAAAPSPAPDAPAPAVGVAELPSPPRRTEDEEPTPRARRDVVVAAAAPSVELAGAAEAKPKPKPPVGVKPPVEAPRPPVEAPKPLVEAPKPPVEAPKPPVEAPTPTVEPPKPPVETPKPPVEAPTARVLTEARVVVSGLQVGGGMSSGAVKAAVNSRVARFRDCFKEAAGAGGRPGSSTVQLSVDEEGLLNDVSVSGSPLPGMDACVRKALSGVRASERPDTGTASARFKISYIDPDGDSP